MDRLSSLRELEAVVFALEQGAQPGRKARFDANIALLKCAYGVGPPPTRTQLIRVKRLEDDAEKLRLNMDETILWISGVWRVEDVQARLKG